MKGGGEEGGVRREGGGGRKVGGRERERDRRMGEKGDRKSGMVPGLVAGSWLAYTLVLSELGEGGKGRRKEEGR